MENSNVNIKELNERIQKESEFVDILSLEMGKVIVGQKNLIDNLLIGRAWQRPLPSVRWPRRSMPGSAVSSLPRTCCRPTWSVR